MKTIWLDVLTPKQAILLGTIALRLMNQGFKTIVTTRSYDYTHAVLKNLGLKFVSVGGYGEDLVSKLIEEIDRMKELVKLLDNQFDTAIAYPNPVLARIAFGLGKPYIALTDSPHSEIVSRLSLPLAKYVVISRCIPIETIEAYVYRRRAKVVQYNGVDEVEWLKEIIPDANYVKSLGLEPFSYIVIRPPEIRASYYSYDYVVNLFNNLIAKILDLGYKLVYLPRYTDDPLIDRLQQHSNVIIPSRSSGIIGYHVVYHALAVVTGGGTLAREAALLGTLGISLFPEELYVDKCLQDLGLPLLKCKNVDECLYKLQPCLSDPERFKSYAMSILKTLEKPSDVLAKLIRDEE